MISYITSVALCLQVHMLTGVAAFVTAMMPVIANPMHW